MENALGGAAVMRISSFFTNRCRVVFIQFFAKYTTNATNATKTIL
jgi:hypothetical protein